MNRNYKTILLNICAMALVFGGVILAGTITPPSATPDTTFFTLEDIYSKLTNSGYNSSPTHNLGPSVSTSVTTMHSIGSIFSAIPPHQALSDATTTIEAGIYATTTLTSIDTDLSAGNIASGTEMFGITGTFVCTP